MPGQSRSMECHCLYFYSAKILKKYTCFIDRIRRLSNYLPRKLRIFVTKQEGFRASLNYSSICPYSLNDAHDKRTYRQKYGNASESNDSPKCPP